VAAAQEIKLLIGDSVDKVQEGIHLVEQAGVTMAAWRWASVIRTFTFLRRHA